MEGRGTWRARALQQEGGRPRGRYAVESRATLRAGRLGEWSASDGRVTLIAVHRQWQGNLKSGLRARVGRP